jgi:hypothetical protein
MPPQQGGPAPAPGGPLGMPTNDRPMQVPPGGGGGVYGGPAPAPGGPLGKFINDRPMQIPPGGAPTNGGNEFMGGPPPGMPTNDLPLAGPPGGGMTNGLTPQSPFAPMPPNVGTPMGGGVTSAGPSGDQMLRPPMGYEQRTRGGLI